MADGKIEYQVEYDTAKAEKNAKGLGGNLKKLAGIIATTFAVKKIFDFGTSFETSFAKASTVINEAEVDMKNLEKQILDLSDTSGIASTELNEGLYQALSAGIPITKDAAETMAFMERMTQLAKGGFTDITTAIDATTSVINAYGLSIDDANNISNILIKTQNAGKTTVGELSAALSQVVPVAAAMGVGFDEVGASLAALTAQGVPTAQATTQMNRLFAELGKEGTEASDILKNKTGKSFQELVKEGKSVADIVAIINDEAVANNKSLLDMFGSIQAGQAALNLTGKGAEIFEGALESMRDEVDAVTEAADTMNDTTEQKLTETLNQLKNVLIEVFLAIGPILAGFLGFINSIGILKPLLIGLVGGFIAYKTAVIGATLAQKAFNFAKSGELALWAKTKVAMLADIAIKGLLIGKTIALAIVGAAAAVAAIPIVGPILAVAAVAGITALILGAIGAIPLFAKGGIVKATSGGTMGIIGEAGNDEAVVPLTSKGISAFLGGVGGMGINTISPQTNKKNITINLITELDGEVVATSVVKHLDEVVELLQPDLRSK